jgi:predicted nucleotidyltransferase
MPEIRPALTEALARCDNVLCAWLFGSHSTGRATENSDIDIGILVRQELDLQEFLSLQGCLQDALEVDNIDLVVLNSASPTLRFEAINGELLVNRDPDMMARFVSVTCREYESVAQMLAHWPMVS